MASMVSPRSDVEKERTGELAFESAEDAACLILEMGAVVHTGRDAVQRARAIASSRVVPLYRAVDLGEKASMRMLSGWRIKGKEKSRMLTVYVPLWRFPCETSGARTINSIDKHSEGI